ncbi:hypothetical protein QOZ80_6AG0505800 [Eleusine coracana subsp. coracana]|nr:hypothetical protein QOZ80_6AG0505800 [Eleusine coracana subsp. coracana]
MASDSDDADFFDKLVDSDSDDDRRPLPLAPADVAEASAGDLAALTLADHPHHKAEPDSEPAAAPPDAESEAVVEAHPAVVHPEPEAPTVEAGSPLSEVKQVQWNNFGASSEADPFGADGAEDAFFEGAVPGDDQALQDSLQTSASAVVDHGISSALENNANSNKLDSSATVDQNNHAELDYSTDPKYWESLYPGWKYDATTQQWYQVDAVSAHQDAVEVQSQPELVVEPDLKAAAATAMADHGAEAAMVPPAPEPAVVHPKVETEAVVEAHPAMLNPVSEPPEALGSSLKVEAATTPEGSSPRSDRGIQTAVKQVQWNDFGASNGADPFGDLVADGAEDAFFESAVPGDQTLQSSTASAVDHSFSTGVSDSNNSSQLDSGATAMESMNQSNSVQLDSADPKYWESLYPGWKYDEVTQQWYQDASQATLEPIAEEVTTNAASWGQDGSYVANTEYPPNMLFYAEYPGWYFDTDTQQWQSLESYQQTVAQTAAAPGGFSGIGNSALHTQDSYTSSYTQQSQWQPGALGNSIESDGSADSGLPGSFYGSDNKAENHIGQQAGAQPLQSSTNYINTFVPSTSQYSGTDNNQASYEGFQPSNSHQSAYKGLEQSTSDLTSCMGYQRGYTGSTPYTGHQGFKPSTSNQSWNKGFGHSTGQEAGYKGFEPSTGYQTGFEPSKDHQRSSAGRPPHALVTFGFGGKLLVLKEISSITANFDSGTQGNSGRIVSILNMPEIVADKIDHSSIPTSSALSYFHALYRHPIPGPLIGGSAAAKDVNKWFDDIIGGYDSYESSLKEFQGGDAQKLIISLLKISCQHYGKLRSPFGSDPSHEGIDGPEMAVTKLFASYNSNNSNMKGYRAVVHCMKNIPSESQIQATALEVQNLLVSGRRKEALQSAQEGQLWGPALILALQLGDKFYADTVKKMARCHFVSGSPLRTLCLLIAGQPADVFSSENPVDSGSLHTQPPAEAPTKSMLDDWQENLAILTANRTKGDDLVITHLGDCLWKEKNEVASAHSCYLVAERNIDSYSESARMCLIGADHLRCPRTFISPEAIQRTEVYEYAKVLGNSQYILLPFQPYKLIYAYMLAEVGKVSDSLRYCQASLKVLKASGHAPEALKQLFSSLEERIRTHQQGGYAINLAPGKIVGKIFTSLDKSLSRIMGTQSAPLPQPPQGTANEREILAVPDTKVVNTQSVMSMSPLMSSTSELSMSEMSGAPDRTATHNRSISEPDFGKAPPKGAGSGNAQSTSSSGNSRFGWLVQKTVGLVSKSRKQAKLGEQNKFYYDEKLKRWVEEGAEVTAEEPPLPPPPSKSSIQNNVPDYNLNAPVGGQTANGFAITRTSNPSEHSSGMPPIPPTQNQFSARARMGVRSRYVDTFNKGSGASAYGAAASFGKPAAASSMSPLSGAKFFVPTPAVVASEQMADTKVDAHIETTHQDEPSPSTAVEATFSSPPPSVQMPLTIHRHPSMDNIMTPSDSVSSSLSRSRAASWSGTYPDQFGSTAVSRSPDGQVMQSPLMPGKRPPHSRSSSNSSAQFNGLVEDLHEVEL